MVLGPEGGVDGNMSFRNNSNKKQRPSNVRSSSNAGRRSNPPRIKKDNETEESDEADPEPNLPQSLRNIYSKNTSLHAKHPHPPACIPAAASGSGRASRTRF